MKKILASPSRDLLERFARADTLLVFDFDGTLAPIVDDPSRARIRPRTRSLLRSLSTEFPIALLSGRSYKDLKARAKGFRTGHLVGNHGQDWGRMTDENRRIQAQVREWKQALLPAVSRIPGAWLEDKTFSLSLHYRDCGSPKRVEGEFLRAAGSLKDVRVVAGHRVLNLVHRRAADKGDALLKLLKVSGCRRAIFVGDDVTDEDAFRLGSPRRLLTIRVGKSRGSRAFYYLQSQAEIDQLLLSIRKARQENAS